MKVAHQPLHSSIRVNWEFSSNCGSTHGCFLGALFFDINVVSVSELFMASRHGAPLKGSELATSQLDNL